MTSPQSFYAVDPGLAAKGGSGWAFFQDNELAAVGLLRNRPEWKMMGQRVRGQVALFREAKVRLYESGLFLSVLAPVVAESMVQIYRVPAQDLIDLQTVSGALGSYFVRPGQWKGAVPRDVEISRTMAVLFEEEKEVLAAAASSVPKSLHKELTSAIGIGLSVARRAHRKIGWPE